MFMLIGNLYILNKTSRTNPRSLSEDLLRDHINLTFDFFWNYN